jgi:hypothetical protein
LPQQQNVREGNIKKCDDLLHLATSLEICSTRTRGCLGPQRISGSKTAFADFIDFGCSTRVRRFTAGYRSAGTPSPPMLIFPSEQ